MNVGTKAKSIESTLGMWLEKGLKTKMVQTHNLADEEIVELVLAKLTKARKDLLAATKLADQAVEGGSSKRAALEASISQVWADCVPCSISRVVSQSAGQA